jgi:DNA-binding transcriptional ArsR family regulator
MHEFELLADPTRRRIVELLAHQELSVAALTARLGDGFHVCPSAVSHQLKVLRDADFVDVRAWGSERRYRLKWDAMDRVDAAVETLWIIWDNRSGWPYETLRPASPPRLHRVGRSGLRCRTAAEIEPRDGADDPWSFMSE